MSTTSGAMIQEKRKQKGWSRQELADAVGSHPRTIEKIERGVIEFSRFLLPIHQALGIDSDGTEGTTRQTKQPSPTQDRELVCFVAHPAEDAEEFVMMLRAEPTMLIPRPRRLNDFEDAYAVMVAVAVMEPAYEIGDTLYINPDLPAEPGKDVLLRKELAGGGAMVILARLVGVTRDGWQVRQHASRRNKEFTVAKNQYPRCHRIIGKINR